MIFKRIFIIVLLSYIFLAAFSSSHKDIIDKNTYIHIKLEVVAPFSSVTIKIDNDGNISYKELICHKKEKKESKKISRKQLEALAVFIVKNRFFSMESQLFDPARDPLDLSAYSIEVKINKKYKKVICYGDKSKVFITIKNKIIEVWGKDIPEIGV